MRPVERSRDNPTLARYLTEYWRDDRDFGSGDAPVGQGTLMPPQWRRVGFRVSIGVIAEL